VIDFTLGKYKELCQTVQQKYTIYPVYEYLLQKSAGSCVVLRHDVDRNVKNSLSMARMEHDLGIRSTYYFRFPYTFHIEVIRKIHSLGHEIGYHYEVLSKTNGDLEKAISLFAEELQEFRKISPVNTICMHGSPLSKYNNRDLWARYDYHSHGIYGEAFLSFEQTSDDFIYLTDTGRTWSGKRSLRDVMKTRSGNDEPMSLDSTDDLIRWIRYAGVRKLYLTIHPERWSENIGEWLIWSFLDFGMNVGKEFLKWQRS
jgi:hypothetical protein